MLQQQIQQSNKISNENLNHSSIILPNISGPPNRYQSPDKGNFRMLGLSAQTYKKQAELKSQQQSNQFNNPFKIQRTTEELLIQREQERFLRIKREKSISHQISQSTTLQTLDQSLHEGDSTVLKNSHINGKIAGNSSAIKNQHSRYSSIEYHNPTIKSNSNDYFKNLAFQTREGQIRLVNQIGCAPGDSSYKSPFRKNNLHQRLGTVNTSIDLNYKLNNTSFDHGISNYNSAIDPLGDLSLEKASLIIRDLPPTIRYLTKNVFGQAQSSPKESTKEAVRNIRNIFYTQMSIDAKAEESVKLREYIIMEIEKLEEARRTFDEDKDKFHKYLNEMEQQAEKARENTEQAARVKQELTDKFERIQYEIQKYEREALIIEDDLKQNFVFKEFIESVKAQRKFKAVKQSINEDEMAQKSDVHKSTEKKTNLKDISQFFITENNNQDLESINSLSNNDRQASEKDMVDLSKNEFLDIIQSLEDANIFLLDNIQDEEQELEAFIKHSEVKYSQIQYLIDEIQSNIDMYNTKITEKKSKKKTIKGYLKDFDLKGQGGKLANKQELKKKQIEEQQMLYESQMKHLKALINKLYYKIKQTSEVQDISQQDTVQQLSEIERKLDDYLESRDYIQFKGESNPDQLKSYLDAEKLVDKDRKQIRYEKKKKIDQEVMKEKQLKVERRMQRSIETNNGPSQRIVMARSLKPDIKKQTENDRKILTQEDLDYTKYVEGSNNNPNLKML